MNHLDSIRKTWNSEAEYVRSVWGPEATFDVVGLSLAIHLDRPDAATRKARCEAMQARAADLEHADCPLCREMAALGGDEVYDADGGPVEPNSGRAERAQALTFANGVRQEFAKMETTAPEAAPVPGTAAGDAWQRFREARKYARRIRNATKQTYAFDCITAMERGEEYPDDPEHPERLSAMAAQAVRLHLDSLLKADQARA